MDTFYHLLFADSQHTDQYLASLAALTKADRGQMHALASDLAWQVWGEQ